MERRPGPSSGSDKDDLGLEVELDGSSSAEGGAEEKASRSMGGSLVRGRKVVMMGEERSTGR